MIIIISCVPYLIRHKKAYIPVENQYSAASESFITLDEALITVQQDEQFSEQTEQ